MQKYQDLSEEIQGIRRPINIIVGLGVGLNIVILGFAIWMNFFTEVKDFLDPLETCKKGVESVVSNNIDPEIVNIKVIEDIDKKNITFNVERIHLVKYLDGFHCDVIIKDPNGYRSFLVSLEKNTKFKHLYKILDIKGQKIVSRYQR